MLVLFVAMKVLQKWRKLFLYFILKALFFLRYWNSCPNIFATWSKKSNISCNNETWHSYTLPKEDPKNIWLTWHTPWVLLTPACFHRKSVNFTISGNKMYIAYWYIIPSVFNLFWVSKGFSNKPGCSFDDVRKNGYSRPP